MRSYGYHEHQREYGNGKNRYRTQTFAQPRVLKVGDVLVTGDVIARESVDVANGGVQIFIKNGSGVHEVRVPGRIPIALRRKT